MIKDKEVDLSRLQGELASAKASVEQQGMFIGPDAPYVYIEKHGRFLVGRKGITDDEIARRVAACWNYCKGIPIHELEAS